MKLPLEIFEEYKDIQTSDWPMLTLMGFTSTSLKKEVAFKFMFKGLKKEDVPVLYQINNLRADGLYYFKLDNAEYSLFPYEQEVLLTPGSDFFIHKISEEEHQGSKY